MTNHQRIAYFTAGSAGAGHLVRGVALGRALERAARAAHREGPSFRIFAPPSPFSRIARPWLETVELQPALLRVKETARGSAIARAIAAFDPHLLVIDLFWVPLFFVPIACPTWLLLRSVPPAWLVGPKEARFDAARYERVLSIEPAPGLERFESIDPIVVTNASEVRTRAELAALLGQPTSSALRVVAQGGLASDRSTLSRVAEGLDAGPWTNLDLAAEDAPFPAAEWLGALTAEDRLVASPGYNLYWEARALGFDARTTWVPIPRKFDDPAMRAALSSPSPRKNGADTLAHLWTR